MKNWLIFVVLFGAFILSPKNSLAQTVESQGQFLVHFGRTFAEYSLNEKREVSGGMYAHASAMIPSRSTPQLFGYFGPELTIRQANFKLLTGTFMTSDGGMSVLAAFWYNQKLPCGLDFTLDGDVYFPVDGDEFGHEFRQYQTHFVFNWTINPDSGLGVGILEENFFSEDEMSEAAVGPTLNFKKGNLWVAYDFTPSVADDHSIIFRLTLNL